VAQNYFRDVARP